MTRVNEDAAPVVGGAAVGNPERTATDSVNQPDDDGGTLDELMRVGESERAYWTGFDAGEKATHEQYQRWLGVAREGLKAPTQNELARARQYTDEPCSTSCGRCSRCIRASAVIRNKARYGSPDYPGGPVEWGDLS